MGTHPIFESDFDCLIDVIVRTCGMSEKRPEKYQAVEFEVPKFHPDGTPISKGEQKRMIKELKKQRDQAEKAAKKAEAAPAGGNTKPKDDEDNLTPNQYTEIRKKKLDDERNQGINPYPHKFHVSTGMQEFCEKYSSIEVGCQSDDVVSVAGRIYSMRPSGSKLVFYDLRAEGAKIQIMANMAKYHDAAEFSKAIEKIRRGDIVGVKGNPGKTKKGELSHRVKHRWRHEAGRQAVPQRWHRRKEHRHCDHQGWHSDVEVPCSHLQGQRCQPA